MTSIIHAEHLSKWYGQVLALNDVEVEVGSGITALIGPNGAGKSTFLWILTGQLAPSQGKIKVYGESPWRNPALFHRVGFCPETDGIYRNLTGLEFVTLLARLGGWTTSDARKRAKKNLKQVGLAEVMNRRLGTYSKGMRQRVKIAQTLVHNPDLLILDEPLSGLDPLGRHDMLQLFRDLVSAGKDIVISSHVLHEVEAVTSRILLMGRGRILAQGDVREIRALIDKHPHHVRIQSDRLRELARVLIESDDVISVTINPGKNDLVVQTNRPDEFYEKLQGVLVAGGYDVAAIESQDDNLAAVFKYLVE